ncbi:hypothetical protein M673_04030 [Aureimonas sp. AU20]|nr:HlyD family efflux transporter periplasmic adaptor subunit [Aureimonas sp. AU20]ALN71870.1 hypothetical protein M673_04030 [Aureimonas sp. AU20]
MRPISLRRYIVTLFATAALALCAFWFGIASPKAMEDQDGAWADELPILAAARGTVDVEGGLLKISAPREGLLVAVPALEGQRVAAGDVLAVLDARQEEQAAKIAKQEVRQAEEHQTLLRLKMKALSKEVDRMRRAAAGKAVSDQALDEVLASKESLAIELNIAASALTIAQERRDGAEREVELRTLRAPVDGLVVRRRAKAGEIVSPQLAPDLFVLLPDGRKIVLAEIPEQFLKGVEPGNPVEVLEEDRLARAFPGRIERISPVLMQASGPTGGERNDIRTAASVVSIDQDAPFRIGQRVIIRVRQ